MNFRLIEDILHSIELPLERWSYPRDATMSSNVRDEVCHRRRWILLRPSAAHSHLSLDDLVRWSAIGQGLAGESLSAVGTAQISVGVVLDDSILEALDQSARAALAVPIQELAAVGTVNPDRPCASS